MADFNVLLSIVIANYNYGHFLDTAIRSVLSQSCQDFELIIVDGGSTDNSVEIIRKHADKIAWWCSEKDKGQSDAFNKGFAHAKGRFLTWLNADDVMIDGTIERLANAARKHPEQQWFAGGSVHFGPDGKVILCTNTRRFSNYEARHGQIVVYAPSSFFTRDLFNCVGGFDEFFRYSMDTYLWCRFFALEQVRFMKLPGYVFGFRYHANSKTTCVHFKDKAFVARERNDDGQGQLEHDRIRELFPSCKPMRNWERLLRTDWIAKVHSIVDTWRYRGKSLVDCGFVRECIL